MGREASGLQRDQEAVGGGDGSGIIQGQSEVLRQRHFLASAAPAGPAAG